MAFTADGHFSCSERAGNAAAFDATIQFRRRQFGEQKILFWFYVTYPYGNCFRTVPYLSLSRRNAPFHFWMILRYLRHCVILLPPLFFFVALGGLVTATSKQLLYTYANLFALSEKKNWQGFSIWFFSKMKHLSLLIFSRKYNSLILHINFHPFDVKRFLHHNLVAKFQLEFAIQWTFLYILFHGTSNAQ